MTTLTRRSFCGLVSAAGLRHKGSWPHPHHAELPDAPVQRSPGLLYSGLACGNPEYISLWRKLSPSDTTEDHVRVLPLRQPILWV